MFKSYNWTTACLEYPEYYAQIKNHNMALKQMISKHNSGSINYLQVQSNLASWATKLKVKLIPKLGTQNIISKQINLQFGTSMLPHTLISIKNS
jgi:hypothetical protein